MNKSLEHDFVGLLLQYNTVLYSCTVDSPTLFEVPSDRSMDKGVALLPVRFCLAS